jgi:hypothetical protein
MVQVPLSRVHRHIYFAASAACFSTVCAFGLFAVANRGSQWWLLVALTAFFCVMLLTLARSIYGPHSKV